MLTIPYDRFLDFLPDLSKIQKFLPRFKSQSTQYLPTEIEVLRAMFVKNLVVNNQLQVRLASGDFLTVTALAYDRINNLLIVSEKADPGLLLLEKGDTVEFYSALDDSHEYFSFFSTVVKTKMKGMELHYYMSVPKRLKKSRRRVLDRKTVENHSIIRIDGSFFSGRLLDISYNGLSCSLNGYYPGELEVGCQLKNCTVDIFQPRINDNISFVCNLQVKRFEYHSRPERCTIIGATYTKTDGDEKKILRYLEDG